MATKNKASNYTAKSIMSVSQHTHLLKRMTLTFGPEMGYSESPYSTQKTVAIREVIDNSVDEVLKGFGNRVSLKIFKDGSVEVQDNGRGIPVDVGQDTTGKKMSGIQLALGVIQSGSNFEEKEGQYSTGTNGVGASSTIHTSKRADITVYRDNKKYELSYQDGTPGFFDKENDPDANFTELSDYTYLKKSKDDRTKAEKKLYPTGTKIRVWQNDSVFKSKYPANMDDLIVRLRGVAFLIPKITIDIYNEQRIIEDQEKGTAEPQQEEFHFEGGLKELVTYSQQGTPIIDPISIKGEGEYYEDVPVLSRKKADVKYELAKRKTEIEVAFSWDTGYDCHIDSYVNTVMTRLHGIHVTAFEKALVKVFSEKFSSMRGVMTKNDPVLRIEDFKEGLTAAVYAQATEPAFTAQNKEQLSGEELQKVMTEVLVREMRNYVNAPKNAEVLKIIGNKVVTAARNRQAIQEAKKVKREANAMESNRNMPEKLVDCDVIGESYSELYLAEGDSALSSLKGARDGRFQALLPLRGKIVNAVRATPKRLLEDAEVKNIFQSLGAGWGENFDLDKSRYQRVFIAADADADGGEIFVLAMALLWYYARPLFTHGRVYKMLTPLYIVKEQKKKNPRSWFCNDENEFTKLKRKLDKEKVTYHYDRIKGLGQCPPAILAEVGMNPETRVIQHVDASDAEAAAAKLQLALSDDVPTRRQWIEDNPQGEEILLDF